LQNLIFFLRELKLINVSAILKIFTKNDAGCQFKGAIIGSNVLIVKNCIVNINIFS